MMEWLRKARKFQIKHYDKRHNEIIFKFRDKVLMSIKNLKLTKLKKSLCFKYLSSLKVIKPIERNVYRLEMLNTWSIYDIINVSHLKKWTECTDFTQTNGVS
jgi:hypothetical protein